MNSLAKSVGSIQNNICPAMFFSKSRFQHLHSQATTRLPYCQQQNNVIKIRTAILLR